MKQILPIFLIGILALTACRSTKSAYEKGDFEKAVFNSIDRLRKSPNNSKSRETLAAAYPSLVEYYQDRIDASKQSADQLRWEKIAAYYKTLNNVYKDIQRAPAARDVVPNALSYDRELTEAEAKSAESRYALGTLKLKEGKAGDRESAKEAYYHYKEALEWRPGYRDAESMMNEARDYATVFVRVDPIPMHSRTFNLTNEFFENQMLEYIRARNYSPFVAFYSGKSRIKRENGPDQVIEMIFDDFVVGQSYVKETVLQRRKDNVVVGTTKVKEDSVVDVLGTVEAEMHQFRKEISSSGLLDFRIIDTRSRQIISQRKFPGTFIWIDRWGYYNGDKRALSDEDKEFTRKKRESPNPSPQDLFIEFTKPIFSQVTDYVNAFYSNY